MSQSYIPAMLEPENKPAKLHIYTKCFMCKLKKD